MFVLALLTMFSIRLVLLCYAPLHVFITGKDEFQVANVKHGCTLKSSGITNSSARFLIVLIRITCPLDQCAMLLAKIAQIIKIQLHDDLVSTSNYVQVVNSCQSTFSSSQVLLQEHLNQLYLFPQFLTNQLTRYIFYQQSHETLVIVYQQLYKTNYAIKLLFASCSSTLNNFTQFFGTH